MIRNFIDFIKSFVQSVKLLQYFGYRVAILDFICEVLLRWKGRIGQKFVYKKHEHIKSIIKKEYETNIAKYKEGRQEYTTEKISSSSPIWVFWWQGLVKAPEIIKTCLESIVKYAGGHEVRLITRYNYSKYVEIPDYIMNKLKSRHISITHFSDILRIHLLYQYGGLWIDATVFLTDYISDEINDYGFYTINHGLYQNYHVCKGKWSTFFIATAPNNPLFEYLMDIFHEYLKKEKIVICYLLIDCLIALGYENVDNFKKQIDYVPLNNTGVGIMKCCLNQIYNKKLFDSITKNSYIHKLTYKFKYKKGRFHGRTLYGYLLEATSGLEPSAKLRHIHI
ncbi:MAG: capsular biosynthesis protein [Herbinix sp.]|jgi:hypothetical protein|nr:capsular biosynthesis protein [Herbinix sp.]